MTRIRYTKDVNNKVTATDSLEVPYIRIQPIVTSNNDKYGDLSRTKWKIFFSPNVDVVASDTISYNGKDYEITTYYPVRDKDDIIHHIEVTI